MGLTNGERLMKLETKLDMHIEQGNKDTQSIMAKLQSIIDTQDSFDKKYSAKWVETGILTVGASVVAGAIFLFIKLI